jgi:hypothetical protein
MIHVGSLPLLSFSLPWLPYSLLVALWSCFQTRPALEFEILCHRHQINVLRRVQRGGVRLTEADRHLWAWLLHLWLGWPCALIIVITYSRGSKPCSGQFASRIRTGEGSGMRSGRKCRRERFVPECIREAFRPATHFPKGTTQPTSPSVHSAI